MKFRIVIGTYDNFVYGFDVDSSKFKSKKGKLVRLRPSFASDAHIGTVKSLCSSDDGMFLLSGGKDEIIKIFDMRNVTEFGSLHTHQATVSAIGAYRNSHFFTCDMGGNLKICTTYDFNADASLRIKCDAHRREVKMSLDEPKLRTNEDEGSVEEIMDEDGNPLPDPSLLEYKAPSSLTLYQSPVGIVSIAVPGSGKHILALCDNGWVQVADLVHGAWGYGGKLHPSIPEDPAVWKKVFTRSDMMRWWVGMAPYRHIHRSRAVARTSEGAARRSHKSPSMNNIVLSGDGSQVALCDSYGVIVMKIGHALRTLQQRKRKSEELASLEECQAEQELVQSCSHFAEWCQEIHHPDWFEEGADVSAKQVEFAQVIFPNEWRCTCVGWLAPSSPRVSPLNWVVTGGGDGCVRFWEPQTGTLLHTISALPSVDELKGSSSKRRTASVKWLGSPEQLPLLRFLHAKDEEPEVVHLCVGWTDGVIAVYRYTWPYYEGGDSLEHLMKAVAALREVESPVAYVRTHAHVTAMTVAPYDYSKSLSKLVKKGLHLRSARKRGRAESDDQEPEKAVKQRKVQEQKPKRNKKKNREAKQLRRKSKKKEIEVVSNDAAVGFVPSVPFEEDGSSSDTEAALARSRSRMKHKVAKPKNKSRKKLKTRNFRTKSGKPMRR